jgi:hypothetical protein
MNLIKMNGTKVELRNKFGNLIRVITERAQTAHLNQSGDLVLVTGINGSVDLRNINGNIVRNITTGAQEARFFGSDVVVYKSNRKGELRNINGLFIRNI